MHKIKNYLARRKKIRQTTRELRALSDYELRDIGISRYDIPRVARLH